LNSTGKYRKVVKAIQSNVINKNGAIIFSLMALSPAAFPLNAAFPEDNEWRISPKCKWPYLLISLMLGKASMDIKNKNKDVE
jgi:hypothetical protein